MHHIHIISTGTIQALNEIGVPVLTIATKVDKLKPNELTTALSKLRRVFELPDTQPIAFSSTHAIGRRELWRGIRAGIIDDFGGAYDEPEFDDDNEYSSTGSSNSVGDVQVWEDELLEELGEEPAEERVIADADNDSSLKHATVATSTNKRQNSSEVTFAPSSAAAPHTADAINLNTSATTTAPAETFPNTGKSVSSGRFLQALKRKRRAE